MSRVEAIKRRRTAERSEDDTVLRTLADDESPIVRSGVARNERTPGDVLTRLALDRSRPVVFAALGNPSLPVTVRYTFAQKTLDPEYASAAEAGAPEVHRAALHALIVERKADFRAANQTQSQKQKRLTAELALAKDPALTPEQLNQLALSASTPVRVAVARNPQTPEYALYRLVSDPDRLVRNSVSINPSIPLAMRRRIVSTESDVNIVGQLIATSPEKHREELAALARKSPHEIVRSFWAARAAKQKKETAVQRKAAAAAKQCPTPSKKKYPTESIALGKSGWASKVFEGKPVGVYPCRCGSWHMTTKVKKPKRT
jgi:hypothetical protein